jgi:hypothetical protein
MSIQESQPTTENLFNPTNHRVLILKSPNMTWFTQKVSMPGITNPPVNTADMFANIPRGGDKVKFDPLAFTFKVQDDFSDYLEIFNWIYGIGFPQEHQQYKTLIEMPSWKGLRSDISIMLMTQTLVPSIEFTFHDAFPISLSGFQLDTDAPATSVKFVSATATFVYTTFDVKHVLVANCAANT